MSKIENWTSDYWSKIKYWNNYVFNEKQSTVKGEKPSFIPKISKVNIESGLHFNFAAARDQQSFMCFCCNSAAKELFGFSLTEWYKIPLWRENTR